MRLMITITVDTIKFQSAPGREAGRCHMVIAK